MKKEGFGDLEARFLALKESLQEEGLFDDVHKKSLPKFPLKIGIIASFSSAALEDMLKIIKQKGYFLAKIYIFNALTQGQNAPNSLINALRKADSASLDVLIMARGGGSREDLFCFNDEALAREIFAAKTPIISAIGHEIDYVISDFVADLRAQTPSAAIDILLTSGEDLEQRLDFVEDKLKTSFTLICKNWENQLFNLAKIFKANSLPFAISQKMKHLENLKKQLELLMKNKIQISFLEFEKLKNAYLQHENFFEKSRHLISLKKNGKIVHLEELKSGDVVLLSSQNLEKEAKIL